MFRRLKKEEGFTLVELMVVVMIIGILVAIAVPTYARHREEAEKRACQANLRILEGAIAQYRAVNGSYPAELDDLVPDFIKAVPKCPSGGTDPDYDYDPDTGAVTCPYASSKGHTLP